MRVEEMDHTAHECRSLASHRLQNYNRPSVVVGIDCAAPSLALAHLHRPCCFNCSIDRLNQARTLLKRCSYFRRASGSTTTMGTSVTNSYRNVH
jgi:hypothetical protein